MKRHRKVHEVKVHEGLDFTCKECGSHRLLVEHSYQTRISFDRFVPCDCGHAHNGRAAEEQWEADCNYEQIGYLSNDHQLDWESPEREEESPDPESDVEIYCQACYDAALDEGQEWEQSETEEEPVEGSDEFYVRCGGCGREIEFGWSHPDRGGRIWPAESRDFIPRKAWPEPRYLASWIRKSWVRSYAGDVSHDGCRENVTTPLKMSEHSLS